MKLSAYQDKVMQKSLGRHKFNEYEGMTKERLTDMISYSVEEMLAQVDTDLPVITQQREHIENERLMMKQLIANIERNRIKWRQEQEQSHGLSMQRQMALQSVKDKLDK